MRENVIVVVFYVGLVIAAVTSVQADYVDFIQSKNSIPTSRAEKYVDLINKYSYEYDINRIKVFAIAWQESHFRNIRSQICVDKRTGEIVSVRKCETHSYGRYEREVSCGIMQIKPSTFSRVMGYPPKGETKVEKCNSLVYDYETTIEASIKYLAEKKSTYGPIGMISAYNAGYETDHNRNYVNDILDKMERLGG